MPDSSFWAKLFEKSALFLIVLGVVLLVVTATGGLPIGNPPLRVADVAGRVALGVVALVLVFTGILLAWREANEDRNHKSGPQTNKFFVKTYPRSQHPTFFAEVERLVPKARQITLIATGLNLIWEKRIVDVLIERAKSGDAKITICMGNPYSPHVQDRLIEEEMAGEHAPVGRDGIERNTKALIDRLRLEGNPS